MASPTSPYVSFLLAQDPSQVSNVSDLQLKQLRAQRQNAIAKALMSQSMEQEGTRMAGQVAIRNSPWGALAKGLQGYMAGKMGNESDQANADAETQMMLLAGQGGKQGIYGSAPQASSQPAPSPSSPYEDAPATAASAISPQALAQGLTPKPMDNLAPSLSPQAEQRGPLALPNAMPPEQQLRMLMTNPQEFDKAATAAYAPQTDLAKMQMALQLATPGSPQAQQIQAQIQRMQTAPGVLEQRDAGLTSPEIRAGAMGKIAKESEIDRKVGNFYQNPILHERGFTPKIPEYSQPNGAIGQNGQIASVSSIPGAQGVAQANAQATATGSASGGIQSVTMPDGSVIPMRGAQAAPVVGIPTIAPAGVRTPGVATVTPQRFGQSSADAATQPLVAKEFASYPEQQVGIKQSIAGLEKARGLLDTISKTGPGMPGAMTYAAYANNAGIPIAQGDVTGYQSVKKYLNNALAAAAQNTGASGSDARFEQFSKGQPDESTMNIKALKGAVDYVTSQQDAAKAAIDFKLQRSQVLAQQGVPNAQQRAKEEWSKMYDPKVFEFNRMSPEEKARFKADAIKNGTASQFGKKYNEAHSMGWVQ